MKSDAEEFRVAAAGELARDHLRRANREMAQAKHELEIILRRWSPWLRPLLRALVYAAAWLRCWTSVAYIKQRADLFRARWRLRRERRKLRREIRDEVGL